MRASSRHRRSFRDDLQTQRREKHRQRSVQWRRTSRLGVLSPDTETPVVTKTTVGTDLLQPLQIVTELRVDGVRQNLAVLAIDDITLPVQEPCGDLELGGVLDDCDETLEFVRVELSSPVLKSRFRMWN